MSVHENEVATEFKDLDADSSDESIAAVPTKGFGAPINCNIQRITWSCTTPEKESAQAAQVQVALW